MKIKDLKMEIIVALCLLGGYALFWIIYAKKLNDANSAWYEKQYLDKQLNGVLKSIDEFDGNPFKITISIKNPGDDFHTSYGVICVDKEFRAFVAVGDSVFKERGAKTMNFCKLQSGCREYALDFCGDPR